MRYLKHKKEGGSFRPKAGFAVPFFLVLMVLTVVSFVIPLRPTESYSEKRALAAFPEFSVEALMSGSYFDEINLWFSDTFPGRESWISLSREVEALHGHAEISIQGEIPLNNQVQVPPETETTSPPVETTEPPATETSQETTPPTEQTLPPATEVLRETTPPTTPVEEWGGLHAGDADVNLGAVIQIDDFALNYFGYSEYTSEKYAGIVNNLAAVLEGMGVNLVSAPAPTSIGIMVENEYMAMLGCEPQDAALDYMHSFMADSVIKVDTVRTLIPHNDEYIYFRTDHHWSALAAYYVYEQIMIQLGREPAPLDSFEAWDQGEFHGSLYYQCANPNKLTPDNVIAYKPAGDLHTMIYDGEGSGFEWDVLTDMTKSKVGSKYMTFLAGDHAMTVITNNSLPDAPNCLMVKDSYGNCFAPFLTQNYHTVYVMDYREYYRLCISRLVEQYDIQDVILIPNLGATQSESVCDMLQYLYK